MGKTHLQGLSIVLAVLAPLLSSLLVPRCAEALSPFTLGPGSFVSTSVEKLESPKAYWPLVTLSVDPDGKVSGQAQQSVEETPNDGGYSGTTLFALTVDGQFDATDGMMTGTVSIRANTERKQEVKEFDSKYHLVSESVFSGKWKGQATAGQPTVRLVFTGEEKRNVTKHISQNGRDNGPSENTFARTDTVDFPISGELTASENSRPAKLEDSGARFSDISGQVEVLLPTGYGADGEPIFDEENWTIAKLDMELPYGTKLKLDRNSALIMSFADMTTYEMRTPENLYPHDSVEIIMPLKPKGDSQLKLLGGQLWGNLKRIVKDGSMEIEMSQAAVGIKGTTFVLEEDGTTSSLRVLEGSVEFTDKSGTRTETVGTGEAMTADAKGLGEKTPFDIQAEQKNWDMPATDSEPESAPEPVADRMVRENLPAQVDSDKGSLLWWVGGIIALVAGIGVGVVVGRRVRKRY